MKAHRISVDDGGEDEQRNYSEKHLPGGEHCRRESDRALLEENVGKCRGRAADRNADAAPKSPDASEIEQPTTDQRDSGHREQRTENFLEAQGFIRKHPMREQ